MAVDHLSGMPRGGVGDRGYDSPPNPEELRPHLSSAIDRGKMGLTSIKGQNTPYTGWVKDVRRDGATQLFRMENGEQTGPTVSWHGNGKKWDAGWNLKGKLHGAYIRWDKDGNVVEKKRFKNGKPIE